MKTYTFKFTGRKVGSIGKTVKFTAKVQATSQSEAHLMLYNEYEHITILTVKESKIVKSKQCSKVLQLMDKDKSYSESISLVLNEFPNIKRYALEKELNFYI